MIESVTIASVPLDIKWADKTANLTMVAQKLALLKAGTDVVVLPELFSTGFVATADKVAELAETNNGETMSAVAALASKYNVAIAGSFLARSAGRFYNRAFMVEPSGESTFYDKRHLFSLSKEAKILTAGNAMPPLVRFRGWTFSLIVCYDLRFPVWCRNRSMAYDVMLVPANWPDSRLYPWQHLLIARAIENQSYYVGANRSGSDEYGCYDGTTFLVDYYGRPIGEVDADTGIAYAVASRSGLEEARRRMPTHVCADTFDIEI